MMTHTAKVVLSVLAVVTALFLVGLMVVAVNNTEAETVSVTPQSCIDALDASEELTSGPVVRMTDRSLELLDMISRAFEAGLYGDTDEATAIVTELDSMTADIKADNEVIEELVTEYNDKSDKCRESVAKSS